MCHLLYTATGDVVKVVYYIDFTNSYSYRISFWGGGGGGGGGKGGRYLVLQHMNTYTLSIYPKRGIPPWNISS